MIPNKRRIQHPPVERVEKEPFFIVPHTQLPFTEKQNDLPRIPNQRPEPVQKAQNYC